MAWAFLFEFRVLQPTETIRTNPRLFFVSSPLHFFMSHYRNHAEFYDKPILLTADEISDPYKFIAEFFDLYPLNIIRETNRDADEACLASDMAPFEDSNRRHELMLYRWFETKLLEATYVILQNRNAAAPASGSSNPGVPASGPQKPDQPSLNPTKLAAVANGETNDLIHFGDVRRMLIDIQSKVTELREKVILVWGEQALAFMESQKKPK
jgi:hypothetical protein